MEEVKQLMSIPCRSPKEVQGYYTVVSWVSTHGHLNIHDRDFGLHGNIISIHLYRSCYIDPLKWGTWALTREWALARDTMVIVAYYDCSNLHEYRFIDHNVIFNRHTGEGNNFPTVPINGTHMCDTEHHQLLVLVNMELFSKIFRVVWHWIGKSVGSCTTTVVMSRIHPL